MRDLASVERWLPETQTWVSCASLPAARLGAGGVALRGAVVMTIGGAGGTTSAESWSWVAGRDSWQPTAALQTDRYLHGVACFGEDAVLVVGGLRMTSIERPLQALSSAEVWHPSGNVWRDVAPLPFPNGEPVVTALPNGDVLLTGGYDEAFFSACFICHRGTETWSETGSLAGPRAGHTATLVADGRVLVVGGGRGFDADTEVAEAELWDPQTGTWTTLPGPHAPRIGHTATLLQDGRVLVAGGRHDGVALATAELWQGVAD